MSRVTILFNDSESYVSVVADEFHEDGNFIKAYKRNELVAMVDVKYVKAAYRSDRRCDDV